MKSHEEIEADLDAMGGANYYSEDYELEWAAHHYHAALSEAEKACFGDVLKRRLRDDPSLVTLCYCARLRAPGVGPLLAGLLNAENQTGLRSRALMTALGNYDDDVAFRAVERFVDSDQSREALAALAAIDFPRARPRLFRYLLREDYADACLHLFRDRAKRAGFDALVSDVATWETPDRDRLRQALVRVLNAKPDEFNPFTEDERRLLVEALG